MIKVKNLTVKFEDNIILDNVSADIHKNKLTSIIGKSGSGKSVFMKTIIGLLKASEGDVFIDDLHLKSLSKQHKKEIQKRISMVFQNSALFDSLNIFQNVSFPLYEHTSLNYKDILEKVNYTLELVNLKNILDLYPSDLSGGMRKRVALARAIIQEPDYIIYDEPTTGLDPVTSDEIINLIGNIHKSLKMSSIVITHDPECIKQLTEDLIMIDNKKIIFQGTLEEFHYVEHPVAKSFIYHIFEQ